MSIFSIYSVTCLSVCLPAVRVCVPAVQRQCLRRPQEDLHSPAGSWIICMTLTGSVQPVWLTQTEVNTSCLCYRVPSLFHPVWLLLGEREESESEAVPGGAQLSVYGQYSPIQLHQVTVIKDGTFTCCWKRNSGWNAEVVSAEIRGNTYAEKGVMGNLRSCRLNILFWQ